MAKELAFGYRTVAIIGVLAISIHFDNEVTMSKAYINVYIEN